MTPYRVTRMSVPQAVSSTCSRNFGEGPSNVPIVELPDEPNTGIAVRTLQRTPKFKSLFDQLGLPSDARNRATEVLMSIANESGVSCLTAEAHASRAYLDSTNAITFTDEDMEANYLDHRKPLYLTAQINSVNVKRALVDTGASLNLIPLNTLRAAGISTKKIVRAPLSIAGFGKANEDTIGHIQLDLKIGSVQSLTTFHVVDVEASYHLLLGRPWVHKHRIIPSTYHQCVKGRLNGKVFRIPANSLPFDQTETHFVEATFYDELAQVGEATVSCPMGMPLPNWREIKDNPDMDLRTVLERKRQKKEAK